MSIVTGTGIRERHIRVPLGASCTTPVRPAIDNCIERLTISTDPTRPATGSVVTSELSLAPTQPTLRRSEEPQAKDRSCSHVPEFLASALTALAAIVLVAPPADAAPKAPPKDPIAVGRGGAVSSVDPYATEIGLNVLERGGNAVDAAVATAAALGVTEPYSAGIGGGGFFVYYDARSGKVHTIDGRETAPAAMQEDSFVDPGTGLPIPFADAVTSGLSVGVPGTPATWELALDRWGSIDLKQALRPAARLATRGFVVDETFQQQTAANAARFAAFTSTRELFLPGGAPPEVGSVLRNPDLARTYTSLGKRGTDYLYDGRLGEDIVATVMQPPVVPGSTLNVRPGLMRLPDLDDYRAVRRAPTLIDYRGLTVAGMAPPSSGGSTVGEALNILERSDLAALDRSEALHRYLEATALAFADRNRYVGDPAFVDVPLTELLSQGFADERACLIGATAAAKPVPPGSPDGAYAPCAAAVANAARWRRPKGVRRLTSRPGTGGGTSSPTRSRSNRPADRASSCRTVGSC